jgi:hypothetical protein
MDSYSLEFATWFTNTCLNTVKHPRFGKHGLTMHQLKYSDGEYKNKLHKEIDKHVKAGSVDPKMFE